MISVGVPSYVADYAYAYQQESAHKDVSGTEAQAFAAKLFYAMRTDEAEDKTEETAEAAAAVAAQADEPIDTLSDALEENTVLSCILKMREKMGEMYKKVLTGNTQPSFRIGSSTFTLDEWEEFLSRFDTVEEAYKAAMRAEYRIDEKLHATRTNAAATSIVTDPDKAKAVLDPAVSAIEPLLYESVISSYPPEDEDDEPKQYITWFNEDGVFCREQGQTDGYLWSIELFDKDSLNKILSFIDRFNPNTSNANLEFAAQESFWRDYLAGNIDETDFVRNYVITDKDISAYLR